MTMIERAARAAADAAEWDYDQVPLLTESIVRAVLQAIRTPSEGMVEAAWDAGMCGDNGATERAMPEVEWQAMIDAALSE